MPRSKEEAYQSCFIISLTSEEETREVKIFQRAVGNCAVIGGQVPLCVFDCNQYGSNM